MEKRREQAAQTENNQLDNLHYVSVDLEQSTKENTSGEKKISHVHVTDEGIHFEVRIVHHPVQSGSAQGTKIIETTVHVPESIPTTVLPMPTITRAALEMMMMGTLLDFPDLEIHTSSGWTCTGSGYEAWLQFLELEGAREETMKVAIRVAIRACVERGIEPPNVSEPLPPQPPISLGKIRKT